MDDEQRTERLLALRERAATMAYEQLQASIDRDESPGRVASTAVRLISALNRNIAAEPPADADDTDA